MGKYPSVAHVSHAKVDIYGVPNVLVYLLVALLDVCHHAYGILGLPVSSPDLGLEPPLRALRNNDEPSLIRSLVGEHLHCIFSLRKTRDSFSHSHLDACFLCPVQQMRVQGTPRHQDGDASIQVPFHRPAPKMDPCPKDLPFDHVLGDIEIQVRHGVLRESSPTRLVPREDRLLDDEGFQTERPGEPAR
jgi:hypothetical protein